MIKFSIIISLFSVISVAYFSYHQCVIENKKYKFYLFNKRFIILSNLIKLYAGALENKDKEDFNKLFDEQIVYLKEAEFLFDSEKILKQLDHHSNHCYAYNHLRQEKDLNIDEDIQSRNKFHTDFNTLIEEMKKYLSIKDHEINPIKTIPKYYKNSIEWIKELN